MLSLNGKRVSSQNADVKRCVDEEPFGQVSALSDNAVLSSGCENVRDSDACHGFGDGQLAQRSRIIRMFCWKPSRKFVVQYNPEEFQVP